MNLVGEWASLLFHGLVAAGVRDVVVSPGSRSTPFVLAAADRPELRLLDVVDERSAGFVALGQARASARPTVLLCTSGSAPAHYHPAVIEADRAHLPLVLLTADRPWELHDAGANQTVDQVKLFGGAVRGFFDLGAPEPHEAALRGVLRVAAQAVGLASWPTPGPVHVNARVRKPLEPGPASSPEDHRAEAVASRLRARAAAPVVVARPRLEPGDVDPVAALFVSSHAPWIVAGPNHALAGDDAQAVFDLARRARAPLFAEATSQLRFTEVDRRGVVACDAFDALLRAPAARGLVAPDLVVSLGDAPVSGALPAFLEANAPNAPRVTVAPHARVDPENRATHVVAASVGDFARLLAGALPDAVTAERAAFAERVARAAERTAAAVDETLAATGWTESTLAAGLPRWLQPGALLVVGNSLPIRQVDLFASASRGGALQVLFQRGASGIDGLVAGAAGAALAGGRPTVVLLGDVSFQHDVGSLAVARQVRDVPLVVVVVQNGGGRIFETLPVAQRGLDPARLAHFVTPTEGLDFVAIASGFGVRAKRSTGPDDTEHAVREALARPGATVVEVVVPADGARRTGRELLERIERGLAT